MSDDEIRAALEAAIDEHPDQASNYLVLADHLQERGDPRGELIAMWRTETIFGERARKQRAIGPPEPPYGSHDWFYGFVRSFRTIVDEDSAETVATYLDHPSLRHVTNVNFQVPGGLDDERQWIVDLIAARQRPTWRTVTINSYRRGGNAPPCGDLDLSPIWSVMPRLRRLEVSARYVTLGGIASPTLEMLVVDGEVTLDDLEPLLAMAAPKLRELELYDVDPRFANLLAKSPLAAQLTKAQVPPRDPDRYEQTGE